MVASITSILLDIISLIEQIKISSGTGYGVMDLTNVLFSIPKRKEDQKQLSFTWKSQHFTFTHLHNGYVNCPALS